jgi:hypothetical protein
MGFFLSLSSHCPVLSTSGDFETLCTVWSVYFFYKMVLTQAMEWMIMSSEGWACSFFMPSFFGPSVLSSIALNVLRNCNKPVHALTALRVGGGLGSHNVWVANLRPDAHCLVMLP